MLHNILNLTAGARSNKIIAALFAYYFNRIDQRAFIDYVGDDAEGRRIKDIARKNGYILMNCKLYAYAVHHARFHGRPLPKGAAFGVTTADAALLRRLNLKHVDATKWRPFTLQEFKQVTSHVMSSPEVNNYIGRFVSKSMKFLMRSYGETRHDLNSFLQEQGIIAIYISYPFYESQLHMINIAKATIHNKGQSHIKHCTSKSRQRLQVSSEGGFESVHVHVDTLAELEAPTDYSAELRERLSALASVEHKMTPKAKAFILAAAGQYDEGFSLVLGTSNTDAVERMNYDRYLNSLRNYYGVTEERMENLFTKLRTYIHRCNNEPKLRANNG
jgi:hypothetical protein